MSEALRLNFSYSSHLYILNIKISHNIIKAVLQASKYQRGISYDAVYTITCEFRLGNSLSCVTCGFHYVSI